MKNKRQYRRAIFFYIYGLLIMLNRNDRKKNRALRKQIKRYKEEI
jgi:hypothetical protein